MFSPPLPRGSHRQKSHASELPHWSLSQQDVKSLYNEALNVSCWSFRPLGVESRRFGVLLTIFILFFGCYVQYYTGKSGSARMLFYSPYYRENRRDVKVEEKPAATYVPHPPCRCDGEWMIACSDECMKKNTTNLGSGVQHKGGDTSFSVNGQSEFIKAGGAKSLDIDDLNDADSDKPSDAVAAAAEQDLEELVNALYCDCSGQAEPSCASACASRNETERTSSCFCDGKSFDVCPQKCIPVRATKVENMGSMASGLLSDSDGGFLTNGITVSGGASVTRSASMEDGADFVKFTSSNSSVAGVGIGNQYAKGWMNFSTGELDLSPSPDANPSNPPCICEKKYYRVCTNQCLLVESTKQLPSDQLPVSVPTYNPALLLPPIKGKVDNHPDHVIDLIPITNVQRPPKLALPSPGVDETVLEEDGEIIRHRKVYVTEGPKLRSMMQPLKITIPIRVEEPKTTYIDPPPPVFKMRTYTEYETKPETIQMPVITTIIKPKNVKQEQFVE